MSKKDFNDSEKKKKYTSPEQIKFKKKLSVKSLPEVDSAFQFIPSQPDSEVKMEKTENIILKKVNIIEKALEKQITIDPKSKLKDSNQEFPSVNEEERFKKLSLKSEEIKLNLKQKMERIKPLLKKITPISSSLENSEENEKIEELIKPDKFISHETNITDHIISTSGFNFSRELKKLIKKNGSNLSLRLCDKFIEEMLSSLEEPLKFEDLEFAAKFFVESEKKY